MANALVNWSPDLGTVLSNEAAPAGLKISAAIEELIQHNIERSKIRYEEASKEYSWNLPLGTTASIWREGCIIRSQFLGLITAAFAKSGGAGNLLMAPAFMKIMKENHGALRAVVAEAAIPPSCGPIRCRRWRGQFCSARSRREMAAKAALRRI